MRFQASIAPLVLCFLMSSFNHKKKNYYNENKIAKGYIQAPFASVKLTLFATPFSQYISLGHLHHNYNYTKDECKD